MKKTAALMLVAIGLIACRGPSKTPSLAVDESKIFSGLHVKKVFSKRFLGRWCLPVAGGVVCDELTARTGEENTFRLYDYDGRLLKKRVVPHGQGPDEVQVLSLDTVWLSSRGDIRCIDNEYLKFIDPRSLNIRTIAKLANAIPGYGGRFCWGRVSYPMIETRDDRTVTAFESTGYPDDFRYYLVFWTGTFEHFAIAATETREKPPSWKMREEARRNGKRETYIDYYGRLRELSLFSVDWKRDAVFLIPDIERPEIERIDLRNGRRDKYSIDLDPGRFLIDRDELEAYFEYATSETPESLKRAFKQVLYIPPHAPALMGIIVKDDYILVITGKRDRKAGTNEILVYQLPSLEFQGRMELPYPDFYQRSKWLDPFYITARTIKDGDEFLSLFEIYRIEGS